VRPPPRTAGEVEPGYLTIDSYPWSRVTEGGRVLCAQTPCPQVPLSPGNHTLTFDNAEQNLHFVMSVAIKSGETRSVKAGLK